MLPEITAPSIEGLKLERLTVPVSDEQLDEALGRLAEGQKSYKDAPKTKKAAEGEFEKIKSGDFDPLVILEETARLNKELQGEIKKRKLMEEEMVQVKKGSLAVIK